MIIINFFCFLALTFLLASPASSGNLNWNYSSMIPNETMNRSVVCSGAPLWNLNICNRSCLSCSASDSFKCGSCEEEYQLEGTNCLINNNIHNFSYTSFLTDLDEGNINKDIKRLYFMDTGVQLKNKNAAQVCKQSTYKFYIAGLFKPTDKVGFTLTYEDNIDRVSVKFNLLSTIQDLTINVAAGQTILYSKKFTYLSDLKGVFSASDESSSFPYSYLFLDALTSANIESIMIPVSTDSVTLITNKVDLNIFITTSSTQQFAWGFNDLVVVTRDCQTCVSKAVNDIINTISNITGYTAIVVFFLVVALFVMIKLEDFQRKRQFQQKLGSASGNLPLKAINRVTDHLQKFRKARDREWAKEDRLFQRLTKKE